MTDARFLFVTLLSAGLLASGVWHIARGAETERLFLSSRNVRVVGAGLLALALPCFIWRGWYFLTLGVILGASGALRLFGPQQNIRLQKSLYPRWCMVG